jgi:hypothetical protein
MCGARRRPVTAHRPCAAESRTGAFRAPAEARHKAPVPQSARDALRGLPVART